MSCFCRCTVQWYLVMVLSACPIAASASEFRIDSYIPERFEDLEWRLTGGGQTSGFSDEDKRVSDYIGIEGGSSNSKNNRWGVTFGSSLRYRYSTVPRFFNLDVKASGTANRNTSDNESGPFSDLVRTTYGQEWYREVFDNISVGAVLELGRYVRSDLFISTQVNWSGSYNEVTNATRDLLREWSDRYIPDTVSASSLLKNSSFRCFL